MSHKTKKDFNFTKKKLFCLMLSVEYEDESHNFDDECSSFIIY